MIFQSLTRLRDVVEARWTIFLALVAGGGERRSALVVGEWRQARCGAAPEEPAAAAVVEERREQRVDDAAPAQQPIEQSPEVDVERGTIGGEFDVEVV